MSRLKAWLFGSGAHPRPEVNAPSVPRLEGAEAPHHYDRQSHGLAEFLSHLRDCEGLAVLDLGGVSQANVTAITTLGHRIHTEDVRRTLDRLFPAPPAEEVEAATVQRFLSDHFDFPEQSFDGVLVWDLLEFLPSPILERTIEALHDVLKPGGHLLAFFHAEARPGALPVYSFRITGPSSLSLELRGHRQPARLFNNRGIEQLFGRFRSVKFFLARDHLREVVVTR
ncbi:MAG TPA: class I SAM-dependent methyltransferase [Bryobacteraceae bacterium]|nr:class I SAM-dependent methyltransferase [Bryobacteraceae bacterium]